MKDFAPIVLFTYNRISHTKQTIEALQKNKFAQDSELFIYSDGGKDSDSWQKVKELRKYLKTIKGFKSILIIERDKNMGLANSIINGVNEVFIQYKKIIVLEDDMITSPYFLNFMNESLTLYEKKTNVASIHAYTYPIRNLPQSFFLKGADCWGWATWKEKWKYFEPDGKVLLDKLNTKSLTHEFNFYDNYDYLKMLEDQINKKNDSWAIRWYASAFLQNMITLYPGTSYIHNIGNDSSGTHQNNTEKFDTFVQNKKIPLKEIECTENLFAKKLFAQFYKGLK